MRPFLSVLIVTYNAQTFIGDCLQSVRQAGERLQATTGATWEAIVVDNASADATVSVVQQFSWTKLIVNPTNRGFAAGVNRAAQEAKGEWLLLLNPDTELDEGAFVSFHRFVHEASEKFAPLGVVGFQLLHPDGSLQPSGRWFPHLWEFLFAVLGGHRWMEHRWLTGRDFSRPQEVDEVSGAALAVRREAFEQVGGMDEGFFLFFEELDLCRRLKAAGWRIVYLPDAKVRHRWGASVKQVPALAQQAHRVSAIRYFRKYHGKAAAWLVQGAFIIQRFGRALKTLLGRDARRGTGTRNNSSEGRRNEF